MYLRILGMASAGCAWLVVLSIQSIADDDQGHGGGDENAIRQTATAYQEALRRGEVNDDGNLNIADAIFILSFLFGGGAEPVCHDAADTNDDGGLNIADAVTILSHLFGGAGPLLPPFPTCGVDPTEDALPKCEYTHCP